MLGIFPHTQFVSIQQVRVYGRLNIGVLDENSLNSCWLNCSLSLVDLIHVSRQFLGLIYWVKVYLVILSVWGGIHGSLGGLELKIGEEK